MVSVAPVVSEDSVASSLGSFVVASAVSFVTVVSIPVAMFVSVVCGGSVRLVFVITTVAVVVSCGAIAGVVDTSVTKVVGNL